MALQKLLIYFLCCLRILYTLVDKGRDFHQLEFDHSIGCGLIIQELKPLTSNSSASGNNFFGPQGKEYYQ